MNALKITQNLSSITNLQTRMTASESNDVTQAQNIAANSSRITTNTVKQGENADAITGLDGRVGTLEGNIPILVSRLNGVDTKIADVETELAKKHTVVEDYFYINDDILRLRGGELFCFDKWNVQDGETIDFDANVSLSGNDPSVSMGLFQDGEQVAYSWTSDDDNIDSLSLFYRGAVTGAAAEYEFCIKNRRTVSVTLFDKRLQWMYSRYITNSNSM